MTIHITSTDKAKFILLQEKIKASSEAKTFAFLFSNFENQTEKIIEVEKPMAENEMRCFLFPAAIAFMKLNKELVQKHFNNNDSLLLNNALIYFLRKLGNRYTLEEETLTE